MKKKSLLMLDADPHYAQIYASRFESAGWKVFVEQTLENAQKKIEREHPNVLIADLDDSEAILKVFSCLRLAPETRTLLQIGLTSKGGRGLMKKAQEAGVDHILLKGQFLPSEAVKKVKRFLEEQKAV